MAGYIGSKASVVSSGAERKKTFAITTSTTSLTGLVYTPNMVHVFHNGIRLVDSTDYTATDGTSITLTNAAANGDEVVVVSYASFSPADAYTKAEADAEFVKSTSLTINSDGFVIPKKPMVRAYQGSAQNIPSTYTNTLLNIDTVQFDIGNYYDTANKRYTPQVAGTYLVSVSGALTTTSAQITAIWKNGSFYASGGAMQNAGYGYNASVVTTLIEMNGTTDYFDARMNTSTANGPVVTGSSYTYISAHLVGESS